MDSNTLLALCNEWQVILRLQDWRLTLELVDFLPYFGATQWDRYKNAHIAICTAHTINPDQITNQDMEVTLVHELLHLHFKPFESFIEPGYLDDALEELIETLAQTLVALRRSGATKKPKVTKHDSRRRTRS